MKRADNTI